MPVEDEDVPARLAKYESMWTTERDGWRLWTDGSGDYIPKDVRDGKALLYVIGDEAIAEEVTRRMLGAGVEVVYDYFGPESRP
jgi:hypothetical protein